MIIVHSQFLHTAQGAAKVVGIPQDRIILLQNTPKNTHMTIGQLIELGSKQASNLMAKCLRPGEARSKLALLSFSSGTTGQCKRCMYPSC